MREEIRNFLAHVRKPYRLAGGEVGSRTANWDEARVRLCLAFPEAYELGMSNIGLAILYDILAARSNTVVERVYAPWADVEDELRARDIKLFSLESQHALHEFDVVGVALPYELTYTNVLNILALGGIPLLSRDRDERHPLVIAGGPCAFNPEPIAEVFDAIVVGDGEDAIIKIADAVEEYKEKKFAKDELLKKLSQIRGIYVPSFFGEDARCQMPDARKKPIPDARYQMPVRSKAVHPGSGIRDPGSATQQPGIRKSIVTDLDATPFPTHPLVPHAATQDRAAVEVQRGCVRGCRFCQAGMTYRPVRQRSPETVCELARAQLGNSGHDALSLVSLSVGDYACLGGVLAAMNENHARVTLPSLRVESLTSSVLECLGEDRAGSFTLAPEASTERMRRMINKGNTDDDLYASVEKVFQNGWSKIKLYFMVGLPGETDDEIDGIVKVANRCLDIGRRHHKRPDVTVATSTFVPKAHTPLQWAGQISIDSTLEIQRKLKRVLRRPGLYYRWQNAEMSLLECAMSRGGRELMPVIMHAYQNGVRFDGWDDCFRMDVWRAAFAANDLDIDFYRAARGREDRFPWDHLFVDLKKEFLWREYEHAMNGETTPNCIDGPCQNCGVCDGEIKNKTYESSTVTPSLSNVIPTESAEGGRVEESLARKASNARDSSAEPVLSERSESNGLGVTDRARGSSAPPRIRSETLYRVRLRFSKLGGTAYLGHLELADALRRTVRRAGVNVAYTQGYRPRPKIDLGRALPVSIESSCEYIDVTFEGSCDTNDLCTVLNAASPEGIRFTEAIVVEESTASIEESIVAANYEVDLGDHAAAGDAISVFNARETAAAHVIRKGKTREIDVKSCVSNLAIREGDVLSLTLSHRAPTLKIGEVLAAIMGFSNEVVSELHVMKVGVHFREAGSTRHEA